MSGNDGINFSEKLARDVKTATGLVLGNRGNETVQAFGRTNVRQTRFYKAPGGGIAAPSDSTTPSSAVCTLMKWNAAGTAIEVTNTTETVYSFSAHAADEVFQAKQVGGKIFADSAVTDLAIKMFRIIELKATEAFDTTDSSFTGIVVSDSTVITILNINVTPTATAWGMEGSNGDSIYGQWVSGTTYQAIQKACV